MRLRQFLGLMGGSLIAAGLPFGSAFAQRQGDEGEYQILQARYGTPSRNIDVTSRLKELARTDAKVQISNNLFGEDPDFGRVKTLRIYARGRDGGTRTFEYREGDVIDGAQFTGWGGGQWGQGGWRGGWGGREATRLSLYIVSARYGDGRRYADVTNRVRSMVRDGRLDINVDNDTLGVDPARRRQKSLLVVYSFNGSQQEIRVDEQGRLTLP